MNVVIAASQQTDYRAGLGFVAAILVRGLYAATPPGRRAAQRKRTAAINKAAYKQWKAAQKRPGR